MTDAPLSPHEADDALAAEYVLGVLELRERAEAEARIRRDPEFASMVQAWETHFAGLNDEFAEAPAPDLLPKIEARLFPKADPARAAGGGTIGRLLGWLGGAVAALILVVGILATVVPPRSELVARLSTADNRLTYEVAHFGNSLKVTRVAGVPAVPGQVHELWVIAPGANPVSLGLLQDGPLVVTYPVPPAGFILAVSVEPAGGSPTGQPTGPVILTAMIGETA